MAIPAARSRTGAAIPVLGLGTWRMGERRESAASEVAALRLGISLGLTLIDTAEMYAGGRAEELVGRAIQGCRDQVYLVTKVLPQNASRRGTVRACEASLRRLGVDHVDLYLLHWEGSHPLVETLEAFAGLQQAGKVLDYGVSNFDREAMTAAERLPGGDRVACNQVLYNLRRRGIEWSLLPWCEERGVVVMAYTPLEPALAPVDALATVARRRGATAAQVALAWLLRTPGVVAIPKAASERHVREIPGSLDVKLDAEDIALLDAAFPPPKRETPLETG